MTNGGEKQNKKSGSKRDTHELDTVWQTFINYIVYEILLNCSPLMMVWSISLLYICLQHPNILNYSHYDLSWFSSYYLFFLLLHLTYFEWTIISKGLFKFYTETLVPRGKTIIVEVHRYLRLICLTKRVCFILKLQQKGRNIQFEMQNI